MNNAHETYWKTMISGEWWKRLPLLCSAAMPPKRSLGGSGRRGTPAKNVPARGGGSRNDTKNGKRPRQASLDAFP